MGERALGSKSVGCLVHCWICVHVFCHQPQLLQGMQQCAGHGVQICCAYVPVACVGNLLLLAPLQEGQQPCDVLQGAFHCCARPGRTSPGAAAGRVCLREGGAGETPTDTPDISPCPLQCRIYTLATA